MGAVPPPLPPAASDDGCVFGTAAGLLGCKLGLEVEDGTVRTLTRCADPRSSGSRSSVLDDGDRIPVIMAESDNEAQVSLGTDYETGSRRHSASIIELDAELSVLGVKQDDQTFGPMREVPLLLTRKLRFPSGSRF